MLTAERYPVGVSDAGHLGSKFYMEDRIAYRANAHARFWKLGAVLKNGT